MTWGHLASGPIQPMEFFFGLACPEPLCSKIMEEGKRESSLTIRNTQSTKGILSCHKGQESRSLKPRTMGIQLYIQSRFSPFILHVYLTSTWIKAILFHFKRGEKKENLASLTQTFGQGRKKAQLRIWLGVRRGICSHYPAVSGSKPAWLEELKSFLSGSCWRNLPKRSHGLSSDPSR